MESGLTFTDRMIEAIRSKKSVLNVGLDPQLNFIPLHLTTESLRVWGSNSPQKVISHALTMFNRAIIDAVSPFAVSVKPQSAFYECYGSWGIRALEETVKYAMEKGLLVIMDAKRGDGGDTAMAYADAYLGEVPSLEGLKMKSPLRADALTVNPWIGTSCIEPFVAAIKEFGTGVFVVVKTSFKPNSEVEQIIADSGRPVWEETAFLVKRWGEGTEGKYGYRNLGVVMGATFPEEAPVMRRILPNTWMLIPGYGAQGGGADGAVVPFNEDGLGGVVNSSREVIAAWKRKQFPAPPTEFAAAAAKAAQFARDDLNAALQRAGKLA